jgi:tripartite-type tricarboxylate transporter receptor subunit TctC
MRTLLIAVGLACAASASVAQTYPTKPVRMIAPYPAGGTSDTIARILGQKLTEAWGQQVVVDNRSGVGGSIGAEAAAKAPPDGYTLLVGNNQPVAVNISVYKKIGYDPLRDFTPITLAVTAPQLVVVHPSVPARNMREFMAVARASKDKLNYGSSGAGSTSQLAAETFKQMTKIDIVHIPFKGSALITNALVGGHLDVVFSDMAVVLPHVQAGKLRALGVTGAKPSPLVPNVPAVAESGLPGFVIESWWGILGPAGIAQPIVSRQHTDLVRALQQKDVRDRFATLGVEARHSTPEEFAALIKSEVARFAKLVKEVGIRAE